MAITKHGSAVWKGGIKDGSGTISTETGALNAHPYGFASRFESGKGSNPEELIAAAHAACFSMALSLMLTQEGMAPEELDTSAAVTIEQQGEGFTITSSRLTLKAKVPGIDEAKFKEIAGKAKEGCPVSKLLNAEVTLEASLVG
ncbi:OsmC family protein [Afifella marina]|uniref:Osmotically inducible protein OsmC n=1 Tax=Afifella marina DSM 2698 TaxID=1120955 RepID=A0A1G5P6M3_AFIMA|nr:OsmC family protein [Afifella marina]MBK1624844.1 OsmC family peroxiredoxin [Afifella marina DSM 2698]MBK1628438.1 OsmC family peroxiredoxin [Afifella marina]MBK5917925.1 OsmC family peroxiredoxin [Afifella marina]RAI18735.1 OsmC family peroxiredoxin [Afifella marina DSM 2698]SCZ45202.1 osmotically inducible protein OsmC [Afifella marina DSM 2698]